MTNTLQEFVGNGDKPGQIDLKGGEILLLDKPGGWSSFDVIRYLKKGLREKKFGHAGTLDPLASGLLIICSGKATKRLQEFQDMEKTYTGTIQLGAETPSYDAETEIEMEHPVDHITAEMVNETTGKFTGEIEQIPPAYSAIKQKGQRSYERARKGEEFALEGRKVYIHKFEITRFELPEVDFLVQCSKGTYIRSLANDFGKALNSGGYLSGLRRTAIGHYDVSQALSPHDMVNKIRAQQNQQS